MTTEIRPRAPRMLKNTRLRIRRDAGMKISNKMIVIVTMINATKSRELSFRCRGSGLSPLARFQHDKEQSAIDRRKASIALFAAEMCAFTGRRSNLHRLRQSDRHFLRGAVDWPTLLPVSGQFRSYSGNSRERSELDALVRHAQCLNPIRGSNLASSTRYWS